MDSYWNHAVGGSWNNSEKQDRKSSTNCSWNRDIKDATSEDSEENEDTLLEIKNATLETDLQV